MELRSKTKGTALAARDATTGYVYDPISRLETLSHDLDGAGSANDATLGFGYNLASQIVTRTLTMKGKLEAVR